MKLILQQYLASLKEREELDAILPDLLSQMGLTVFSRPGIGTTQFGVDVAAVGKIEGTKVEKVYLFSIKSGDLTKNSWDGSSDQALRPSLSQILDTYIPNRLPVEHRDKPIIICPCFGGSVQEQVRDSFVGYIKNNTKDNISFEEWNGDKLANLVQRYFLREELLPKESRSYLRKSLAFLDEPDISFKHFVKLITEVSKCNVSKPKECLMALQQLNICLWIHFSWARDANNLEASYLSAERLVLFSWDIAKKSFESKTKINREIQNVFFHIVDLQKQIMDEFLENKILPFCDKLHALSSVVNSSCDVDVNLKMFDILGRLAYAGLFYNWFSLLLNKESESFNTNSEIIEKYKKAIVDIIGNNPILFLPFKDEHAIEVSLTALLLMSDQRYHKALLQWLQEIVSRVRFSFDTSNRNKYPANIYSYIELLEHPKPNKKYFEKVTAGSILYPMISYIAAILNDKQLFDSIQLLKREYLEHCNFQFWFPDSDSEENMYKNSQMHGAGLSDVRVEGTIQELLDQISSECKQSDDFFNLSATKYFFPLVLIACKHYRLPLPLHIWQNF